MLFICVNEELSHHPQVFIEKIKCIVLTFFLSTFLIYFQKYNNFLKKKEK